MTEFEVIKTANEISDRQLYPDKLVSGIRLKDAYSKLSGLIFQRRRELEALENAELFLKHYIK